MDLFQGGRTVTLPHHLVRADHYNLYVLMKVAGKPGWWLVPCFIPLVNIAIAVMVYLGVAESFGKAVASYSFTSRALSAQSFSAS